MRTISVLRDDLQTFNGFHVADNVIENFWPEFLHPVHMLETAACTDRVAYHGSSYGNSAAFPLAGAFPLDVSADIVVDGQLQ